MQSEYPELYTGIEKKLKKEFKKDAPRSKKINLQECITHAAVNHLDELCEKTLDFQIEILACILQNLSFITLPYGGIYISGGVANFLSSYIEQKQDVFWHHYLDHSGLREEVLEKIPIFVLRDNPTLDGLDAVIKLNH